MAKYDIYGDAGQVTIEANGYDEAAKQGLYKVMLVGDRVLEEYLNYMPDAKVTNLFVTEVADHQEYNMVVQGARQIRFYVVTFDIVIEKF